LGHGVGVVSWVWHEDGVERSELGAPGMESGWQR
jgi:hypothetical protein